MALNEFFIWLRRVRCLELGKNWQRYQKARLAGQSWESKEPHPPQCHGFCQEIAWPYQGVINRIDPSKVP